MKKFGLIAITMALVMAFSQCKKDDSTTPTNVGEKVFVTLKVGNGSKVAVEPETGKVAFEHGDVIHVASNGVYVGTLAYDNDLSRFSGNITEPTEGEKLHFYFLGNQTPEFNSDNSGCSVIISDQTTKLPVISYNTSRENYQVGKTDYSATLLNKCALVKFNVTTVSENATCITGMNNKVTVDFETNEFDYSQEGDGVITISAGDGEKWAILLPQDEVSQTEAHSVDGLYTGICASIPAIGENDYQVNGIAVAISHPMGAINGLFTINANGDQVFFSQGNLQYIGSTSPHYWKFADNQWDYLGSNGQGSSSQNVDRDLFGWGTSGYHNNGDANNVNYQPWSTSTDIVNINYNYYGYGPSTNNNSFGIGGTNYDWGKYNSINNGGNTSNQWRTLTNGQWQYVFETRSTTSGIRYAKANVNGVNGIVLLPDNWNSNYYNIVNANDAQSDYSSNIITNAEWNTLEEYGVVFLPAAGNRSGTTINNQAILGNYWATGRYYNENNNGARSYCVIFNDSVYRIGWGYTCDGLAVRLVQDYNP